MRNLRSHPPKTRPLPGTHRQDSRRARGGSGAVAQALGPGRLRWIEHAGQRCDRSSLSRRQSVRARHVTPRLHERRSALVQLPASGGARMAGAQGREGDARLFLQADRDRGQNRLIGTARRAAFRCCERSRSFMLRKLMASLPLRPRLRRRRSPSASRTSSSSLRRAACRFGSAVNAPFTARRLTSSKCLRTKPFTSPEQARRRRPARARPRQRPSHAIEPRSKRRLWICSLRERRASSVILTVCTDARSPADVSAAGRRRRYPGRPQRSHIAGGGRPG